MFELAPSSVANDRNYIKARRTILAVRSIREDRGSASNPHLFTAIDRELRRPEGIAHPSLHLDENDRIAIHYDDIDLGAGSAKIPGDDLVATPLEMPRREMLAPLAVWQ